MKFGNKHKQYSLLTKGTAVYIGHFSRVFQTKPLGFIIEEPFRKRPKDGYDVKIMKKNGQIMTFPACDVYAYFERDNGDWNR